MSSSRLHSPVENPLNHASLPASRPQLEFAATCGDLEADRRLVFKVVAGLMALSVLTWCIQLAAPFVRAEPAFYTMCGGVTLLLLGSRCELRLSQFLLLSAICVLAFYGEVALAKLTHHPRLCLAVLAAGLLLALAHQFGSHYRGLATATMLGRRHALAFRRWGVVPPGVQPAGFFAACLDALHSWLTYNRLGFQAPGIFRSPAGPWRRRILHTTMTLVLVSLVLWHLLVPWLLASPPEELSTWLYALAASLLAPLLLIVLTCLAFSAPTLPSAYAMKKAGLSPQHWREFLADLHTSPDPQERNSLYLGQVAADGMPVLVPADILFRHMWLCGSTGSGKTSYLIFLLEQLLRRGDISIVIVDLKADSHELLESSNVAVADVRRSKNLHICQWNLTNLRGEATHLCCPMTQPWWSALTTTQQSDVQLSSMGLQFSRAYGESYYSDCAQALLDFVSRKYPDVRNYGELAEKIAHEIRHARDFELSRQVKQDGEHVRLVVDRLAQVEFLNQYPAHPKSVVAGAVDLTRLFQEPCVLYAGLNSMQSPTASGEAGRVLVSSILQAGSTVRQRRTKVILILDEWQQMVAGNLELILRQMRTIGGVILANQTVSDLKQGSLDLTPTVDGNTALKAFFRATDVAGLEHLKRRSGTAIEPMIDVGTRKYGREVSYNTKPLVIDRFASNEVLRAGSHQDRFVLQISENVGYAQFDGFPFVARFDHPITLAEYRRRCAAPWPAPTPETIVVGRDNTPPSPSPPVLPPTGPVISTVPVGRSRTLRTPPATTEPPIPGPPTS